MKSTTNSRPAQGPGEGLLLKKWKFVMALNAEKSLTGDTKTVAMVLLDFHNAAKGFSFPAHDLIAQRSGISIRSVVAATAALKDAGWFQVDKRGSGTGQRSSNRYRPIWARAEQRPAERDREPVVANDAGPGYAFETGHVRLTAIEVSGIEARIREANASPEDFFAGMREFPAEQWSADAWRDEFEWSVIAWCVDKEELKRANSALGQT